MVRRRALHQFVDKSRVQEAIDAAERKTGATIQVAIAPYFWGNVRRAAERAFDKAGLGKTHDRNGVLFFLVPSRRAFAIIGGAGAHEALGQAMWDSTVASMREHFAAGNPTEGLILAIEEIGRAIAVPFPFE
jgi:uncharacterized membrane protein